MIIWLTNFSPTSASECKEGVEYQEGLASGAVFGAGMTRSNGSVVIHFPKYRQYGVKTAHTRLLRSEQFPMLGALEGCSKNVFPNHVD